MNFIIVDSIKGGCGKTLESLAAAVRIKRGTDVDSKNIDAVQEKVCIIDFDILGTSVEQMILGGPKIRNNSDGHEMDVAQVYLNDIVYKSKDLEKTIQTKINISLNSGECEDIDIIMSSPYSEDKHRFRISNDSNYSMLITPTHFRGVIQKLIQKLSDQKYTTIIFDMPPNSDPYTDCIFELLLSNDRRITVTNSVILEVMSGFDRAHVNANIEWLKSIYSNTGIKRRPFDKIRFILNDNSGIFNGDFGRSGKLDIKDIVSSINDVVTNELPHSITKKNFTVLYREHQSAIARFFMYNRARTASTSINMSSCGDTWYGVQKV